tara:strand:- start:589 stop:909 length:321 start_codon:yes stop_codon:yes gene_type:complete
MWLLNTLLTGVLIIGLAVVIYSLAIGTVELVNKIRSERKYREQLAVYETLVSDDVYYRERYGELFSSLVRAIERAEYECDVYGVNESYDDLFDAVNQFIEESKVVR